MSWVLTRVSNLIRVGFFTLAVRQCCGDSVVVLIIVFVAFATKCQIQPIHDGGVRNC